MSTPTLSRSECNVLRGLAIIGIFLHNFTRTSILSLLIACSQYSFGQKTYTFSYDNHGNRIVRNLGEKKGSNEKMTTEELQKHFILRDVANNVKFLQFIDIDTSKFQWIFVYDPNGRMCLQPERYTAGCLINLQSATLKGLYVISFCYNNHTYSYKITVI